jgi:hypothetical protein
MGRLANHPLEVVYCCELSLLFGAILYPETENKVLRSFDRNPLHQGRIDQYRAACWRT